MHGQLSSTGSCSILAAVLCVVAAPCAAAGPVSCGGSAACAGEAAAGLTPPVSNECETRGAEQISRIRLPSAGICLILAAALCMVVAVGPAFDRGSVKYTHDVATGFAPPLPTPIVVPAAGDLEATSGTDNPGTYAIGSDPAQAPPHGTSDADDPALPVSTATGGLYAMTSPSFVTLLLPTGVGLSQDDPNGVMGPSAFYTEFDATWRYQDPSPFFVVPFLQFYMTGDVGAGGFFAFDAEWSYQTKGQGGADHGTVTLAHFNDTPGGFAVPLFAAGYPFILNPYQDLIIAGKMRWVVDNKTEPSHVQLEGRRKERSRGGAEVGVVPLPTALWAGVTLKADLGVGREAPGKGQT